MSALVSMNDLLNARLRGARTAADITRQNARRYYEISRSLHAGIEKQVQSVLWTRKRVRATVVTAGHCTHAELTSGHALASCYSPVTVRGQPESQVSSVQIDSPAGCMHYHTLRKNTLRLYSSRVDTVSI